MASQSVLEPFRNLGVVGSLAACPISYVLGEACLGILQNIGNNQTISYLGSKLISIIFVPLALIEATARGALMVVSGFFAFLTCPSRLVSDFFFELADDFGHGARLSFATSEICFRLLFGLSLPSLDAVNQEPEIQD